MSLTQFKILESVAACGNKRNPKLDILGQFKDDSTLKEIFRLAYDWETTFGVTPPKKLPPATSVRTGDDQFTEFENLCHFLATRQITGNAARDAVDLFLAECSPDEQAWYAKILGRDLKIGINRTTIRKVWPDLIKNFGVQLAQKYEKKRIKFPALVEPKFDGMRATIVVQNGVGAAYSRQGHVLSNVQFIADLAASVDLGYDFVLDGELFCKSWNDTLKYVKTTKNVTPKILDKLKNELEFHVFDALPASDFHAGRCNKPFYHRHLNGTDVNSRVGIIDLFLQRLDDKRNFRAVPREFANTHEEVDKLYIKWLEAGYEGAMIKMPLDPYVGKRSHSWIKYKPFHSIDCKIIDLLEGRPGTKYEGMLGKFTVEYGTKTFNVGSGLSDVQREAFWAKRDEMIGKMVEVKINEDMGEKESVVNFPVFMRMRPDRD